MRRNEPDGTVHRSKKTGEWTTGGKEGRRRRSAKKPSSSSSHHPIPHLSPFPFAYVVCCCCCCVLSSGVCLACGAPPEKKGENKALVVLADGLPVRGDSGDDDDKAAAAIIIIIIIIVIHVSLSMHLNQSTKRPSRQKHTIHEKRQNDVKNFRRWLSFHNPASVNLLCARWGAGKKE
mmetsp:Transcript_26169/g.36000  ORF Transcript_26169/g.36000 Transcript_26169/m.36000 type:complete len:177 (-) Transcript_26169:169-699(-)